MLGDACEQFQQTEAVVAGGHLSQQSDDLADHASRIVSREHPSKLFVVERGARGLQLFPGDLRYRPGVGGNLIGDRRDDLIAYVDVGPSVWRKRGGAPIPLFDRLDDLLCQGLVRPRFRLVDLDLMISALC